MGMDLLNVAQLHWEYGGVQRLLEGLSAREHATIFDCSREERNPAFGKGGANLRIISDRDLRKFRMFRSLTLRRLFSKSEKVLVWDDLRALAMARRYRPDSILYDHSVSLRNQDEAAAKKMFSELSAIIVCSEAQRTVVRKHWDTGARIFVCTNGLPHQFLIPDTTNVRTSVRGLPIRIGMVGRLSFEKGHAIALRAVRYLLDEGLSVRLVVAGSGALELPLKRLAEELRLDGMVEWLGNVTYPEQVYQKIDLLCIPSLWEPFGLVALEAAAYGRPVVAADRGGLNEAVQNGHTGTLVPPSMNLEQYARVAEDTFQDLRRVRLGGTSPNNSEAIAVSPVDMAEAIKKLIEDKNLYSSYSLAARERVLRSFTFDAYCSRLRTALQSWAG